MKHKAKAQKPPLDLEKVKTQVIEAIQNNRAQFQGATNDGIARVLQTTLYPNLKVKVPLYRLREILENDTVKKELLINPDKQLPENPKKELPIDTHRQLVVFLASSTLSSHFSPNIFPKMLVNTFIKELISSLVSKEHWLNKAFLYLTILEIASHFTGYGKGYLPSSIIASKLEEAKLTIPELVETYGKSAYLAAPVSALIASKGPSLAVNTVKSVASGVHWLFKGNQAPQTKTPPLLTLKKEEESPRLSPRFAASH